MTLLVAVIWYDQCLTDEVQFFWARKLSLTAGLFYACRYLALMGYAPIVYATFVDLRPEVKMSPLYFTAPVAH